MLFEKRFDFATTGAYNLRAAAVDPVASDCANRRGGKVLAGDTVGQGSRADVRLRAHTLLCLQGFRGEGYSPSFIDNLARIHRDLIEHPEQWVEVVDAPDT